MRPKHLKSPFSWANRRPGIHDRVLYVPEHYDRHQDYQFPGWSSAEMFGREAPVEIEYCSGNGAWILERALRYPDRNWVAVEIQFERVRKIWSKIHNFGLKNLLAVCGEASTFTRYYIPKGSVTAVYVNFPDPWPKNKHAKKRLLKEPFLTEISAILVPRGVATIVTDHADYMRQIAESMDANPLWEPHLPILDCTADYGTSYFDTLWREQGIPVYYMYYANRGGACGAFHCGS